MREVIIFFKQQCHLCHVALRIARHIQIDTSFTLHAIDITEDVSLLAQYGTRIPVILIDQRERFAGKVTERELRTALKKALEHIDKPDSVPTRLARESGMIISLELELPRTSCSLPEDHGWADRRGTAPVPAPPVLLFGLAPGDAYRAGHVTTTAVGFYSTISPLPDPHRRIASSRPSAVSFLWRWCRIAPPGRYPAPFPWSPDFPPEHVLGRSSDLLQRAQLL